MPGQRPKARVYANAYKNTQLNQTGYKEKVAQVLSSSWKGSGFAPGLLCSFSWAVRVLRRCTGTGSIGANPHDRPSSQTLAVGGMRKHIVDLTSTGEGAGFAPGLLCSFSWTVCVLRSYTGTGSIGATHDRPKLTEWPFYMNISIRVMLWATEQPSGPVDFGEYRARYTLNQTTHAVGSATKRLASYVVHKNTVVIDVFKIFAPRMNKLARPTAVAHVSRPYKTVLSSDKP